MVIFAFLLGLVILIIIALLLYSVLIEVRWYEITKPELKLHNLHPSFEGFRIAHITDIHMDSSMTVERLKKVAEITNNQNPDLIVITGDFVSYEVDYVVSELHEALSDFKAPYGVVAVMGNHDHLSGVEKVRSILDDVGIRELRNDCMRIEKGEGHFYLAGVDDLSAQKSRLDVLLDEVPEDAPAILLAHEPDYADVVAATERFEAQLSGHTHGGQIRIPPIGTLYGPEHGHRYQLGLYEVGDKLKLYVSRGVGTVSAPIRFMCRPEIPLITLHSA